MQGRRHAPPPLTDYSFTIRRTVVETTVTDHPRTIARWIREVRSRTYGSQGLVVGLDCEWEPKFTRGGGQNPVATLQLCVGRRCLIVQMLHLQGSRFLREFLRDPDTTFVGVGVESDIQKLQDDHGLIVGGRRCELGVLAVERFQSEEYRNMGLKNLASRIAKLEITKPKRITLSNWSRWTLTPKQVEYAVSDAYASFAVGMILLGRWWEC